MSTNRFLDILDQKIKNCPYIEISSIVFSIYIIAYGEKEGNTKASILLSNHNIIPEYVKYANKIFTETEDVNNFTPDNEIMDMASKLIKGINEISSISIPYAKKNLTNMLNSMDNDLSFAFSYFGEDISMIAKQSRERKIEFLEELDNLVKNIAKNQTSPIYINKITHPLKITMYVFLP
ncbi:MAG: hypothetical protein ACLRZ9_09395 [Eubacterium sp.]